MTIKRNASTGNDIDIMREEYDFSQLNVRKNPYIGNLRPGTWEQLIRKESGREYYKTLMATLALEYKEKTIYPKREDIFNAFKYTPLDSVKVVILGQDPYHEEGQAHGLAFSVPDGVIMPPSLKNIFKEIQNEYQRDKMPQSGNLIRWAEQGVLLLNTVLTVRAHEANSHAGKGWEIFTDECIRLLNMQDKPIVFMLWGNPAKKKKELLNNQNHLILEAAHPSPLSAYRGFFGCNCFKKCNEFLKENGEEEIVWL